ncbi:hypothetical protein INT43_001754 [Umbelopsis isabellina]|uniref:UBC core domain-containing protein n=1 Tax=Mortierella isabellina TaxID=91625 RepID=A0A8H7PRF5_MORIS|nr:hypothetical protein INT43_001754 [Umbelopsis isabellina]
MLLIDAENTIAVKRILKEAKELQQDPSVEYTARPLEENIFEWHFTVSGPVDTEFDGGRYHGRILLPNEYPFRPPEIIFLTPNGRFELHKKICLSITGFHPEYWQPAWGVSSCKVRTVMLGIMGFFPTRSEGAIGGIDCTSDERKKLARTSRTWSCSACGNNNIELLPDIPKNIVNTHQISNANNGDLPAFAFKYADKEKNQKKVTESTDTQVPQERISRDRRSLGNDPVNVNEEELSLSSQDSDRHKQDRSTDNHADIRHVQSPLAANQASDVRVSQDQHQPSPALVSHSPRWLDGLIMGLLVLIVALVIRKLM